MIAHFRGAGISGKLAHRPPSNPTSRLNIKKGNVSVREADPLLCSAAASNSGFGSKSYLLRDKILGGSLARWEARTAPKESRMPTSLAPEYEAGVARQASTYSANSWRHMSKAAVGGISSSA